MSDSTTTARGEIRVCPNDGEPVVFTMEFPGAEYVCVPCGWLGGIFAPNVAPASADLAARHAELTDRYEAERAARLGLPAPRPREQSGPAPTCKGCGAVAEGRFDGSGKPPHWYVRTIKGVNEYACSRDCTDGPVLPW